MKDIIINQPHLQSFKQKCGSWFLALLSWLLWLYFLLPLFTLGGWLMGVKNLSDEIRWFGGYKTLLELLELYGEIVLFIAGLWLLWCLFSIWLSKKTVNTAITPVNEQSLATAFKVSVDDLQIAKQAQILTVHFDENALITKLDWQDKA